MFQKFIKQDPRLKKNVRKLNKLKLQQLIDDLAKTHRKKYSTAAKFSVSHGHLFKIIFNMFKIKQNIRKWSNKPYRKANHRRVKEVLSLLRKLTDLIFNLDGKSYFIHHYFNFNCNYTYYTSDIPTTRS